MDDVWVTPKKELIIVDYKATSTQKEISLDDEYKQGYKRQIEIYQWLFRQNGFKVLNKAYFVFANASKNLPKFDGILSFEMTLVPYEGNDSWVESTLLDIKKCLDANQIPESGEDCEYCRYRTLTSQKLNE